jgi:hypothetical protein
MSDQKTSLLVNRQVPEYIREEYPLFISFLEAYYEFLENKQGSELNDLTKRAKDLRYLSDVDESIDDFEDHFFNTYASLVSKDIVADKEFLIKNVLPLYLSKGSEKSFKLLFRMMFGQEVQVNYPRNDVLRASDGKWVKDNIIKVTEDISSYYTGDGTTKVFRILGCRCPITSEVLPVAADVYINGALITTGYFIRKENLKIYFDVAPANGSLIEIYYRNIDTTVFVNRQVTGEKSGATAIIEKIERERINNEPVVEFYVDKKTIKGTFDIGEALVFTVIKDDGAIVNVKAKTFSSILTINIIDGGANYNVGDPVPIVVPVFEKEPKAFISKTFSGKINQVLIRDGGAGFQVAGNVRAVGIAEEQLFFAIGEVNTSAANSANVFTIFSDIISDIDPANTSISAADYGTLGLESSPNVNTVISQAFGNVSYTSIGEVSNVSVLVSEITLTTTPTLNAQPATISIEAAGSTSENTPVRITTFGSLGKLKIIDGGFDYIIGDELIFKNKPMNFGIGAEAEVMNVSSFGKITEVKMLPSKITGTANVTSASNVMVQGNGTYFETELVVGDNIYIDGNTRTVVEITSNTSLNVDTAFGKSSFEKKIRLWGKNLLGGQGYEQEKLPSITVSSANGFGANIVVTSIMGDGEDLFARGTGRAGEIQEITIIDSGRGIKTIPSVVFTGLGNGTALANAVISPTVEELTGRWTSSDSILSSSDRKLQGRNYYVNYSYLLSSEIEFAKYKKIFRELLHPAGFVSYAELNKLKEIDVSSGTLNTLVAPTNIRTLSGTVNVNSSIYVVGNNTKFTVIENKGWIGANSWIAVNSEIRMVNAIISDTLLTVNSAFTITANNEELVVMNVDYDAVATEISLEEITAENQIILTVES